MWAGSVLDYGSSRQVLTSLSSCESELRAVVDTWKHAVELQTFLRPPGLPVVELKLSTDKSAAVARALITWRHRCFSMFTCRLQEECNAGRLTWRWIASSYMAADGLTKVLKGDAMAAFRNTIGLSLSNAEGAC